MKELVLTSRALVVDRCLGDPYNWITLHMMTVQEAHERILELDDLIFKAETGQINVTWDHYVSLKTEADTLMDVLARTIASRGEQSYEEAYKARDRVRDLNRIAATMQRHVDLNPETANKEDPLMIAAFHGGADGDSIDPEALKRFAESFDYLFANAPKPPAEATESRNLIQRILAVYAAFLKKAFRTDKLDFWHKFSGGIIIFISVMPIWALGLDAWDYYTFGRLMPAQHLAQAKAACGSSGRCADMHTAIPHLEAISPSTPEFSEASQLLSKIQKSAWEQMRRNLSGEAKDPFKCASGTDNENIVSFDGGSTWWRDDGRCAVQVQEKRDEDAESSSFWPTTVRVDTDMNGGWLPDEERTCQTFPDAKGRVSTVSCDANNRTTHNIPVKFWGGVDRNSVSGWKCRREEDGFVCRAIN